MKRLLVFLLIQCTCLPTNAQNNVETLQKCVQFLDQKVKQIVKKSIYYNYYLGDDLYTERSYVHDASVTLTQQNQIEIYYYLTTQKYDVSSNAIMRSAHGESVVFDPSALKDIHIKGKITDYSKSELGLLVLDFTKEIEKHTYIKLKQNEDPSLLDKPLVYEFELPYLKSASNNPEIIQNAFNGLKNCKK